MIHYEISAERPASHLFNIRITIPKGAKEGQKVCLPNWIPGSYLIRDFAKHLSSITAYSGDSQHKESLAIEKIDSNTWVCAKTDKPIILEYTVYAWDTSVRGAHLDDNHGFFNPCCLLLQICEQENDPCLVTINPPKTAQASQWRVATTLAREEAKPWGYGSYRAQNYDDLIDHPVEMGMFDLVEFDVSGTPHAIVVSGKHDGDLNRLAKDVQKICQTHCDLFKNQKPFERYLFLLTVSKDGYGGLEHRSSTALIIQRDTLPIALDKNMSRGYITLLALFSHEYFHAWNVKKIKPKSFAPYKLNEKCYTKQLWAFEGITSYYDEIALLRAKVITLEQYLDLLSVAFTKVLRACGRLKQSLADSSFDAWIKFYQPNENANNAQVSYYLKGTMAALAFDLALRLETNNESSLDSIMLSLWEEYGKNNIGVPEGKIEELIKQAANDKLNNLVDNALYTTKDLPLALLFDSFGLQFTQRQQIANDDNGGKRAPIAENGFKQGIFEFTLSKMQSRLVISTIVDDGAAMRAGLSAFDEIVALNGMKVDSESFDKMAKRFSVGQQIKVHYFRGDLLKETVVTLKAAPLDTVEITLMNNITPEQKNKLKNWLQIELAT